MESKIDTPKGFGQILDLTFSISRKKFSEFILIMLIFLGPIFVLQAVLELASGVGFFGRFKRKVLGMTAPWIASMKFQL